MMPVKGVYQNLHIQDRQMLGDCLFSFLNNPILKSLRQDIIQLLQISLEIVISVKSTLTYIIQDYQVVVGFYSSNILLLKLLKKISSFL